MSPLETLVFVLGCCCPLTKSLSTDQASVDERQPEQNRYFNLQPKESKEYQAVNAYLTEALKSLEPALVEPEVVVPHLKAAIELIEIYGVEDFSYMKPDEDLFEAKFNSLLNNDVKLELEILNNLLDATNGNCGNESLDFLVLVMEKETFELQVMNILALKLLDKCLHVNAKSLAAKIERSLGKISSSVFDFIIELGERTAARLENKESAQNFAQRDCRGIKISDREKSIDVSNDKKKAQLLKGVQFNNLREIALIINELFNKILPDNERYKPGVVGGPTRKQEVEKLNKFFKELLIEPCETVVQRVRDAYSPLLAYNRKRPARTITSILDAERTSNPSLDYQLEVYRICQLSRANEGKIWSLLETMR